MFENAFKESFKEESEEVKPRKSKMKNIYLILIGLFATSCATVNSVIEGGKEIAMTTVDTTVKTAGPLFQEQLCKRC